MKSHYKRLAKDFFIYSGGNALARLITFFLLPFTTSFLLPSDYGIISSLTLINQFLSGLCTLGFAASFTRCYWEEEEPLKRASTVWGAFFGLILNNLLLIGSAAFFSKQLSFMILKSSVYSDLIVYTFISMGLSYSILPLLSFLRIAQKALIVVSLTLLEILLFIGMTIFLIAASKFGLREVFLIGVISQSVVFILTLVVCMRLIPFRIGWSYLPQMIRLGIPYAVTLIGYFLLQCASRGVLQLYFNMDEVGLYYMGANFARLIELPLVAFINAWFPFYGSFVNKQAEILPTARKILTYYVMGTSLMIAFFFAGARPIVQLMLHSNFSGVWTVIGILAFAQSLWGVYNIFYIGLYFHKKFTWQLYIELSAGALCILFNLILIPVLHREGAAVATLLSFVAICGITYRVNQHLFPIYFEWGKIFRILIGLSAVALISFLPLPLYFYIAMMGLVVIGYLIYLWLFCLDVLERVSLKRIFLRKPLIASKIVKNIETL